MNDKISRADMEMIERIGRLSRGQLDCLQLVDQHLSSKQIAIELGISSHAVDQRIRGALQVLGVERRSMAARLVMERSRFIHGDLKQGNFFIASAELSASVADSEDEITPLAEVEVPPEPPVLGTRLIAFFAPAETSEAMLGDLEELFHERLDLRGADKARRWYWMQVVRVGISFGWRWFQRVLAVEAIFQRIGS